MEPGHSTAAAVAVSALSSLAAAALPATQVIDGPIAGTYVAGDVLVIGWSDGQTPSVVLERSVADYAGRAHEEGDVVCVADVYDGGTPPPWQAMRDRAAAILDAIGTALAANPGLGGQVDGAWLGEAGEWTQRAAADGSSVRVAFAVHYVAEL